MTTEGNSPPMHHSLYTLKPHGDITKFELEDGLIRGTVSSLLSERSSIAEVVVHIPRDETADLPVDVASATDNLLIAISADSEADASHDLGPLVSEFATVERSGMVQRNDIVVLDRTWPGTATPGVALRIRADGAPGVDPETLSTWANDSLHIICEQVPHLGCWAMTATQSGSQLSTVTASIQFAENNDLRNALTHGPLAPFLDGTQIEPSSRFMHMVTEHRISPNENTWV